MSPSPAVAATAARRANILLVDDHPLVRHGLAHLINGQPDLCAAADAATPDEALAEVARHRIDLAVVDLSLGDADGLDLVRALHDRHPDLPVLVCSMHKESAYAERALRAGARGYIMKDASDATVLAAVRRVIAGQVYVSDRIASKMLLKLANPATADAEGGVQHLSDREFEVFRLIGRGHGPSEIARRLGMSVKTVETHREHIKKKLLLPNGRELNRAAMRHAESVPGSGAAHGRAGQQEAAGDPQLSGDNSPRPPDAAPTAASDSGTRLSSNGRV